ncbi:hypothetical protein FGG08_007096 [Glutinoglossum americanum]|uniref:Ankyrin repeat protein n=1 Tax=Glutinoglossum americanum TaxID=1670608 RepID=A0A9P8KUB4_9PEZI|nr:hypothetical protein FGG08_007096 [Glutinoglossum americanum]
MDAAGSFINVVEVAFRTTSALVNYVQDTQHASTERKLLAEESRSLSAVLENLRERAQNTSLDDKWVGGRRQLVRQFQRAYDDLAASLKVDAPTGQLKQESRIKAIRTASRWSFTKSEVYSLLERINRLQQYANTLLLSDQYTVVERIGQKQQEAINEELKLAILSWLSPLQMAQVHQTLSDRPEEGSGRWFLTSEKFLNWRNGSYKQLWSIVVNHLRRQRPQLEDGEGIGVAIIYLKYNEPDQTLGNLLGSLVKQLVEEQGAVPKSLRELYGRHHARGTSPSLDEVSGILSSLVETYTKVSFIVDALDECSEEVRWGLVEKLRGFKPKVHLMITSRFLDSIEEELEGFERLDIKANRADIELFIDQQILKNKNLRRIVEKSPAIRDDIKEGVVRTAEDMFLLARLHVESLASAASLSIRHVRKRLQTLPTTLVGTYDEAMQRIENQEPDHKIIAFKALAWVSYAFRSLSLRELQHALAIEPGDADLDEELVMDGQNITALCAGLVIIDQRSNIVNLVHYTTKNYFENIRHVRFPGFHASITMSCATYLTLSALRDATIREIVQNYPLACYAAQYMGDHARQSPEETLEPSILEVICRLLSHSDKRRPLLSLLDGLDLIKSGFYSQLGETIETPLSPLSRSDSTIKFQEGARKVEKTEVESWESQVKSNRRPEVTALHLAASMGLARVASMLLKETPNIDALDETGKTALTVAIERGFEKAVEFLINNGARVDLRDGHGRAVFLFLTERGWHNAAEIVAQNAKLAISTDTSSVSRDQVQLLLAAYYGNDRETQNLVQGCNIGLTDEGRSVRATALFLAVEQNHSQMVQALLSAGVDVDSVDSTGQTSMHRATRRESEALMRLLIENRAEVDHKNDEGRTAWSANAPSCNEHILGILLDAGADPCTTAHNEVSELYNAASNGDVDYVKFLLKSGANPSAKTRYRWAPLHWAANHGHVECMKLLIGAGAELSPISDQDTTPLDLALRTNQIAAVGLLIQAGAKERRDIPDEQSLDVDELLATLELEEESAAVRDQTDKSPSETKLTLSFDQPLNQSLLYGQFIYPINSGIRSKTNYFQISHPLSTPTTTLSIRHSSSLADMSEYPLSLSYFPQNDTLYTITRITPDYTTLELLGKQQQQQQQQLKTSPPPRPFGKIRMHKSWTGSWKIHHYDDEGSETFLLKTTPDWEKLGDEGCRWIDGDGRLIARTSGRMPPKLCFEMSVEAGMRDVAIACWVGKIWADVVALRKAEGGDVKCA